MINFLTEVEKAYIAGFIDGEGCITILKQKVKSSGSITYSLSILISQADKAILDDLSAILGAGKVHKTSTGMYNLFISRHDSADILSVLLPYLRLKKRQAEIGLEFFQNTKGKLGVKVSDENSALREEYYLMMRSAKQNGLKETRGRRRLQIEEST